MARRHTTRSKQFELSGAYYLVITKVADRRTKEALCLT